MSHSLRIILRCDIIETAVKDHSTLHTDNKTVQSRRCKAYLIGGAGLDIAEVRTAAATHGWKFKPGKPYRHVGATDLCPDHAKGH